MKTYGYDYSFAVSVDEVNKILKDNLQRINLELKYSAKDSESGSAITLDAKMFPWQIIKGGQNSLLRFSIPLSEGYISIEGPISGKYDLTNVTVLTEVTLGWLGTGTTQQTTGSGDVTKLIFSPTMTTDPINPGYVAVVNILDPDKRLDTISKGLLRSYTENVLFENKDKINFIFANVFPKQGNVNSWLTPFKWIYYYSTGKSHDALCFLCMLNDKQWPSSPAFDSSLLTESNNSSILISQEVFFNHVVLPSVINTFSGGGFSLDVSRDELCSIVNRSDFDIKTNEGTITARSFKLTASDSGNGLKIITSGGGPLKFFFGLIDLPNAGYSWSCQNTHPLRYANDKITFSEDPNPITHHEQDVPWYDWMILVALGIVSLGDLIAVIASSINEFSNRVNNVGMGNINNNLEKAVSGSMVNLANVINWSTNDGKKFEATTAGLNGALYIYGNLTKQ